MHFRKVKKQEPPCVRGDCQFGKPKLFIGNHLAWELYQKVSTQVIVTGMGDIIGIRFEAIESIMNIYGIMDSEERVDLFEKIIEIDTVRAKIRNKELITRKQTEKTKSK